MPLHHAPIRAALPLRAGFHVAQWLPRQAFHASRPLRRDQDEGKNHYETLNVRPDASQAEIKK